SPFAGRDGKFLTSRHLLDRLHKEVLGNVSIKLHPTDSAEVMEVAGRGELQLAVLIESMRREGFEMQVSRPEVITKEVNGKKFEPLERGVCDVPDEHVGAVTQALAPRKGRVIDLRPGDPGRTVITFECPSRGLIGFRSLLLTATRGTAMLHQHHAGWMPWCGDLPHRTGGAMISDREGAVTAYALDNLQLRGTLFVEPGERTYEGMVIGESARGDEMVVNAVRAKEKNNIRTHSHDDGVKLAAPVIHTLETAIEWIADDELVEVTPKCIRIRKRHLGLEDRRKAFKKSNCSLLGTWLHRHRVGQRSGILALEDLDHQFVHGRSDGLDQFVAQILVDRFPSDEGVGCIGAPPMQIVTIIAPVASLPFAHERRDPSARVGVVFEADRQLPADVRLPVEWALTGLDGGDVEGAARASGESRSVQEDARSVDSTRRGVAVLVLLEEAFLRGAILHLPLIGREPDHVLHDIGDIRFVDEVSSVRAATLVQFGGRSLVDALTTLAEDALPR
ncbi:MAG: hypothetical protein ACKOD2_13640, partial [Ilumatobacteraceae bacterium]